MTPPRRRLSLVPLVAATYFMVAGGPYGIEDIIADAGYTKALIILAVVPLLWSLPVSLMVGELASAIPAEGGFYVWVRCALGPFWGFQEAWLSLAASVFDMAIYPTLFVLYLGRFQPQWTAGGRGTLWALAVVVVCSVWNLRGARTVGLAAAAMFVVLLSPFTVMIVIGLLRWHGHGAGALLEPVPSQDIAAAVSVALWNYMGWDNASTVAQEVEDPQRNYPRAMLTAAGLVALTYILPLLATALAGMPAAQFAAADGSATGAWVDAARFLGAPVLALAVVVGGMLNGGGMFNALTMSYTRLPAAMAADGLLPKLFARTNSRGVPVVSVVACGIAWALALGLSFERLISVDLVLYGSSLTLEFVALALLRRREPHLHRPFRVPGGQTTAWLLGVPPAMFILFAMYAARGQKVLAVNALLFSALVGLCGVLLYPVLRTSRNRLR